MTWVGPLTFAAADFAAGPVIVTVAGPFDCDPTDDAYVWADWPCP